MWPAKPELLYGITHSRDGSRIDCIEKWYSPEDERLEIATHIVRHIWDGERGFFLSRDEAAHEPGVRHIETSLKPEQSRYIFYRGPGGSELDGYFFAYQKGAWIDLFTSDVKSASPLVSENVDGNPCIVLEGDTWHGHFKLWIDPEAGYNLRRARVRLEADDLYGDRPLGESTFNGQRRTAMEFEVTDVTVSQAEGIFVPMAGTTVTRRFFSNGTSDGWQMRVQRHDYVWNPDFATLGAFDPQLIDGERLLDRDAGGFLQWREGRLSPYVDMKLLESIDSTIEALLDPSSPPALAQSSLAEAGFERSVAKGIEKDAQRDESAGHLLLLVVLVSGVVVGGILVGARLRWSRVHPSAQRDPSSPRSPR